MKDIPQYTKTQIFNPDIKEDYFENIDSQEKAYFLGLIISDGMEMKAITDFYGLGNGCVMALNAGCDILLLCHDYDEQNLLY